MSEIIYSLEGLKALSEQIDRLQGIKLQADGSFWLDSSRRKACQTICNSNNYIYSALPEEVSVSKELKDAIVSSELQFREKFSETASKQEDVKLGGLAVSVLTAPINPAHSLIGTVYHAGKILSQAYKQSQEIGAVFQDRNPTIKKVLSSYRLIDSGNGKFKLVRGKWDVTEAYESDGRGHRFKYYVSMIRGCGIEESLITGVVSERQKS